MSVRKLPLHRFLIRGAAERVTNSQLAVRLSTTRRYAAAAVSGGTSDGSSQYVSPFQGIFDTIQEGKTFLGSTEFTTPEIKYLKCGCPEHVLKYKTTTYGRLLEEPFVKPMEHRVTLQVESEYIPLTDLEQVVFKEIVGTRLDDETGLLQLSSSQFGSRIENKRHVVSMLERLVESAKDLAAKIEDEVGLEKEAV